MLIVELAKKKAVKKVGVANSANRTDCPDFHSFFSPSEVPRTDSPSPDSQSPVWDLGPAGGVGLGGAGAG